MARLKLADGYELPRKELNRLGLAVRRHGDEYIVYPKRKRPKVVLTPESILEEPGMKFLLGLMGPVEVRASKRKRA